MPLNSFTILDISSGFASALCSTHLADHGARVIHLPLDTSSLESFTSRNKFIHQSDSLTARHELITQLLPLVDVLIEDGTHTLLNPQMEALMRAHHVIHASLQDFALDSPHRTMRAAPLPHGALEAFMGLYEVPLGRRPVSHHLALIDTTCAASMTCSILAALIQRARTGHAARITLARADIAYPLLELNALFTSSPPSTWHTLTWAATPFIAPYRCEGDSFIYLHVGLSHHLKGLLRVIRALDPAHHRTLCDAISPETLGDPTSVTSLREHHHIIGALEALFASRDAATWESILSNQGLCAVRPRTLHDWCAPDSHARHDQQVIAETSGRLVPGRAARIQGSPPLQPHPPRHITLASDVIALCDSPRHTLPAPTHPPQPSRPLDGIRVLDLTHVIAGPTSTRQLAELGAEVLRIENPHFDAPWVEAFHIAYNAGKRSMTLDLQTEEGQADFIKILESFQPDIIALNLRPGAGSSSTVTEDRVRERSPHIIYAHMTAYGEEGPWGARPGWEQTAQAVTGVQLDWGADEGVPDLFPLPFNDLCTGLHGTQAMLLGLLARMNSPDAQEGGGLRVSTNLSQTSIWMQSRVLTGLDLPQQGKENLGPHALRRLYRTKDTWGYLVVKRLEALYLVEGLERLQGVGDKALEMSLEAELSSQSFSMWTTRFQRAGVGADEVTWIARRTLRNVLNDPHARAEGLVHQRVHPGVGEVTETGSPISFDGVRLTLDAAPAREHVTPSTKSGKLSWLARQARGALAIGLTRRRK